MPDSPDTLTVETCLEGDRRVIALTGELDIATAPAAATALLAQFDLLDLSGLEFVDSSGLRVLIEVCGKRTEPLPLRGVRPSVRRLLDLTGVCDLVRFTDADETPGVPSRPRPL